MDKKGLTGVPNLDVWTLRGQETQSDTFLRSLADRTRNSGYSLIVLDPIYKLMAGQSENSSAGVGTLCHGIERLMEKSGAAVIYAHHFTKGNQAAKKPMDRMSGSGVFARDADTIITLTEHEVEGCHVVETTLRNMPSPEPFVVEWDFPLMVPRDDLDPTDLQNGRNENRSKTADFLLSLLTAHPLTTTEWQSRSHVGGVSRATFFRTKAKLEASGDVHFDLQTKSWNLPGRHVSRETGETCETFETSTGSATGVEAVPQSKPTDGTRPESKLLTLPSWEAGLT